MNDITAALKTAGVKLPPLRRRVWNWLHDHPNHNSREVATAIHAKYSEVATQVSDMVNRGMLKSEQTYTNHRRNPMIYRTAIKDYELLPKGKVSGAKWEPTPFTPVVDPFSKLPKPKIDVHALPLREARELYAALKEYFGA